MQQSNEGAGFRAPTLRFVWADYQQTRELKPVTVKNYRHRLFTYLKDWLDLPVDEITEEMVEERHGQITGAASANSTFRTLRALLHYAAIKYKTAERRPCLETNPVKRLSELRQWRREKRRTRYIHLSQFNQLIKAIFGLQNTLSRDFLLLLLFTGMRKGEAEKLKWDDVDLTTGIITLHNTKNGDAHQIPLSDYVWNLLRLRAFSARSQWVFPSPIGDQHIQCADWMYRPVVEQSGIRFSPHDIRRTFITLADELDIKHGVIKALVNHRDNDVTEGYTIRSIERLRRATQRISDAILVHGGLKRP